jgi:hypothetical protein
MAAKQKTSSFHRVFSQLFGKIVAAPRLKNALKEYMPRNAANFWQANWVKSKFARRASTVSKGGMITWVEAFREKVAGKIRMSRLVNEKIARVQNR